MKFLATRSTTEIHCHVHRERATSGERRSSHVRAEGVPVTRFVMFAFMIAATPALCQSPAYNKETAVRYAKNLDVARLDANLPSQRLEDWLTSGTPRVDEVQWRMNGCDLKSGNHEPKDRQPLCVRFGFRRGGVGGRGVITIGTVLKGIDGPARFEYAQVASAPPNPRGRLTKKLSEIAGLLDELSRSKH